VEAQSAGTVLEHLVMAAMVLTFRNCVSTKTDRSYRLKLLLLMLAGISLGGNPQCEVHFVQINY
jgi:hypothetical protein